MPNTRIHTISLHRRNDCSSVVELSRAGIESTLIRLICPIVCQSGTVSAVLGADDSKAAGPMSTYHFVRPRTPIWISAMDCQSRPKSTLFYEFFYFLLWFKLHFHAKITFFTMRISASSLSAMTVSSKNNKQTVHTQISFILLRSRSSSPSRYRWTHTLSSLFLCRCDDSVFATTVKKKFPLFVFLFLERVHCAANKIKKITRLQSRRPLTMHTAITNFPQRKHDLHDEFRDKLI